MSSRRESAYSRGGHSRNQTLNHDNTDALHYSLSYKEKWMAQQRSVHAFLQHANTFYVKQTHKHKQHFKICVAGVPVVVLRWLQLREKWSDASSVSNTAFGPWRTMLTFALGEWKSTRCGRTQSRHRSSRWQKLRGASSDWRRKVRMAGANYGLRIET